ncbi:MAG: LysE family translocator [Geminicoccaceae bacterium]|nr:LysE family translocator [Geminicoccaceae bacterium]
MPIELYLAFVLASALLIVIPGPNVALIVGTSIAHGRRAGLITVAGTSAAMVPLLALTVLGLQALLETTAGVFEWLRWIGVAYLIWLGVRTWRSLPTLLSPEARPPAARLVFAQAALVSFTNPKTLLFYAAFFPQFLNPGADPTGQLVLMSATFLALALVLDSGWALLADRARPLLTGRARLRNRITGGFLIGAGIGLALARKG